MVVYHPLNICNNVQRCFVHDVVEHLCMLQNLLHKNWQMALLQNHLDDQLGTLLGKNVERRFIKL